MQFIKSFIFILIAIAITVFVRGQTVFKTPSGKRLFQKYYLAFKYLLGYQHN